MLIEIYAGNYDSQDGLVNGADGIIKSYTKISEVDVIWIKFYDPKIGHHQAKKMASLYSFHISEYWIPILRIERPISIIEKTRHLKIRKHFLVQLACAHTMHRSQGLTLDNVAFDPSGIRKHGLVYTTLSCVRNIQSLYLLNALTKDNFRVKQKIASEMERLQKYVK